MDCRLVPHLSNANFKSLSSVNFGRQNLGPEKTVQRKKTMLKLRLSEIFISFKNAFKSKTRISSESQSSYILIAFTALLEDVLFWRILWLSLSFMIMINILFFVCVHRQINLSGFLLSLCLTSLIMDAIESWLKYKHRTTCLKKLASHNATKLNLAANNFYDWSKTQWNNFMYIRATNHTKAFILMNMYLTIILLIANYINGYLLTYILLMIICVFYKVILPLLKQFKNIKQDLESDCEIESLIPDVSETDIQLLSIEPEQAHSLDERQIYDYWKPDDVSLEECSDSSDNSSSLVTNFAMDKMQTLEKEDATDTSEDEYIPLEKHQGQLQSTLEVVEPTSSWGSAAYNMLWNIKESITNKVQSELTTKNERRRLLSKDSSDGFEIIDQSDLL